MPNSIFLNYNVWNIIAIAVSFALLICATITDIKTMKIPNYITLPAFIIGIVLSFAGCGWKETLIRLGMVVALFLVYAIHLLAGGDIKILMALTMLQGVLPMLFTVIIGNLILLGLTAIKSPSSAREYIRKGLFFMNGVEYGVDKRKVALSPYLLAGYTFVLIGSILIQIIF